MDCTLKRDFLESRQFARVVPHSTSPDVPASADDIVSLKKSIDERVGFGAMACAMGPAPWCLVYTDVLAGASFEAHDFMPVCYECLERLSRSTEWPYGRFQVFRAK
jgi:hypothetical protein